MRACAYICACIIFMNISINFLLNSINNIVHTLLIRFRITVFVFLIIHTDCKYILQHSKIYNYIIAFKLI